MKLSQQAARNKVATANDDTTTCTVQFAPGGKAYSYRVHKSLDVQPGDLVVAEANGELKVVQVTDVHSHSQIPHTAPKLGESFVYCKVDQQEVLETKAAEAIVVAKIRGNK